MNRHVPLLALALIAFLPLLAGAQAAPFISTDPTVVCTTLEVVDGVAFFEGDIEVGACEKEPGEQWEFHPAGGLGRALIGLEPFEDGDSDKAALKASLARRWADGVVPYEIDSSLSDANAPDVFEDIQEAIRHWADGAFIRLVPRDGESNFVKFTGSTGSCSSSIGRITGQQFIRLDTGGACGFGSTVHEIGHAVGAFHEQSRADRDTYVTINYGNIEAGKVHNFNQYNASDGLDVGDYDYGSIMHYSSGAFSSNGQSTIDPDPVQLAAYQAVYGNLNIGNRTGLSIIDRQAVEDAMNICYDGPANGGVPYWTTSSWSSCSATCGATGQTRVVSCRSNGICSDDSACAGLEKPAEWRSCYPGGAQNFEVDLGGWDPLVTGDEFDWTVGIRGTPSSSTGPPSDHTLGAGADGWYAFIEASGPRGAGDEAHFTSVPFVVPTFGEPALTFWFYAQGTGIVGGSLEVEIVTSPCGGTPLTTALWSSEGSSVAQWRSATISLDSYKGQEAQLRFVGTVGSTFRSDVAIDDIDLNISPCSLAPNSSCDATWGRGSLLVRENRAGRESLKAALLKGPALSQSDFGNPLEASGTAYTACLFDDGDSLAGEVRVGRAADQCGKRPCWKAAGKNGYVFKDTEFASDGIKIWKLKGGKAGKSIIQLRGANNSAKGYESLPTGMAAALEGSTSARIEVYGHDIPKCFAVMLDDVSKNSATLFKAQK
ncbi:MAG: M12 family metallopeptidase [Candidatus Binatia bacterium]|nr:M12 family metallopeptidase [Candidatus Binatia bacterium]